MNAFAAERPARRNLAAIVLAIVVVGLIAAAIYLWPRFERQAPAIKLSPDAEALGAAPVEVQVTDAGMGLKSVVVTLSAGGVDTALATERYAEPAREKKLSFTLPRGMKEGPATLKVVARDASLFRGNQAV